MIEIGCVELVNRKLTGNNFHRYINPERDSEEGALAVHGLTTEFLSDKPKFAEIIDELRDYLSDAEIIIHNAPFDVAFLNAEFALLDLPAFPTHVGQIIDTLVQAKELHPGKKNSLDALCSRYGISNAHRKLHGALLDAELLADVFLAMSRGQNSLTMEMQVEHVESETRDQSVDAPLPDVLVVLASETDLEAHNAVLSGLDKDSKGKTIWRMEAGNSV